MSTTKTEEMKNDIDKEEAENVNFGMCMFYTVLACIIVAILAYMAFFSKRTVYHDDEF